ncbi:hypothetical protein [Sphaerisporangium fuscum]|uniref:hypothetical protein n=1 Tax=Sphaerisporangium fuscum TaxID=2835868 RepID=UPI001BDC72BA|nr:hypothetical protein [Sphaerisporangium fuscum]
MLVMALVALPAISSATSRHLVCGWQPPEDDETIRKNIELAMLRVSSNPDGKAGMIPPIGQVVVYSRDCF